MLGQDLGIWAVSRELLSCALWPMLLGPCSLEEEASWFKWKGDKSQSYGRSRWGQRVGARLKPNFKIFEFPMNWKFWVSASPIDIPWTGPTEPVSCRDSGYVNASYAKQMLNKARRFYTSLCYFMFSWLFHLLYKAVQIEQVASMKCEIILPAEMPLSLNWSFLNTVPLVDTYKLAFKLIQLNTPLYG